MGFSDSNATDQFDRTEIPVGIGIGVYGPLSVPITSVEVKVGTTRLPNRKIVTFYNNSGNRIMYWGFNSSVTSATGTPIAPGELVTWEPDPFRDIEIWVVSEQGTNNARVTEAS